MFVECMVMRAKQTPHAAGFDVPGLNGTFRSAAVIVSHVVYVPGTTAL